MKRLLPMICQNPDAIRDLLKREEKPSKNDDENSKEEKPSKTDDENSKEEKPSKTDDENSKNCVFWRFFAEDKDWAILRVITNYFKAVASVFGENWTSQESPLARAIGFGALMRLLAPLASKGIKILPEPRLDQAFFTEHLQKARNVGPFNFANFPANGTGERKLFNALHGAIIGPPIE